LPKKPASLLSAVAGGPILHSGVALAGVAVIRFLLGEWRSGATASAGLPEWIRPELTRLAAAIHMPAGPFHPISVEHPAPRT
jgi:hypothetical protein